MTNSSQNLLRQRPHSRRLPDPKERILPASAIGPARNRKQKSGETLPTARFPRTKYRPLLVVLNRQRHIVKVDHRSPAHHSHFPRTKSIVGGCSQRCEAGPVGRSFGRQRTAIHLQP